MPGSSAGVTVFLKVKTVQTLLKNELRGSAAPVLDPHSRARQTEGKTRRVFRVSQSGFWGFGVE